MYTANKRPKKYRLFLKFLLFLTPFILIAAGIMWYVFFRNNGDITSDFIKEGGQVIVAAPATKELENEHFKITLQTSWVANGKKNPFSDQVYYEFQNKAKNDDNRYLRVYLDVFPKDFALNRLQPITVVDNKIIPTANISDECDTFTGAPVDKKETKNRSDRWMAKWQGIDFVCNLTNPQNYAGTASIDEGLATTFINSKNEKHKYFFLYIDHNVRPDFQLYTDALKSFATK